MGRKFFDSSIVDSLIIDMFFFGGNFFLFSPPSSFYRPMSREIVANVFNENMIIKNIINSSTQSLLTSTLMDKFLLLN